MTQISATLTIPAEQEALLSQVLYEVMQLKAALHEEDILSEEEAAEVLKVSVSTLRKWRKEGWVPFFDEGKLVKHERKALLSAYKKHFGRLTHFGIMELTPKRRAS